MPTPTQGFDALLSEINKHVSAADGVLATMLSERLAPINEAIKNWEIERQNLVTQTTEQGEMITELKDRLARKEKSGRDVELRVMPNGQLRPNVTEECARHFARVVADRLNEDDRRIVGDAERVLSSGTSSEGGYTIAPEYAAEIIRLLTTVGTVRSLFRRIPMRSNTLNLAKLASSITMYYPDENNAITASYPSFGQLVLTAKTLAGLTYIPESLEEDSILDLGDLLIDLFVEGMASEEDRVGLVGDTGSSDPWMGVINATSIVSTSLSSGKTAISQMTADDLLTMQTNVPDGARENARYVLSPTVFDAVRKLKDSNGDYIWQRPTEGAPGAIWGRPYTLSEKLPAYTTTASASTKYLVYGNFARYAFFGDRKMLTVKRSDVAGDTFAKIQSAIRVHERFAISAHGPAFTALVTAAS